MSAELDQVRAALRAAGWRSSEERLQTTALKRLATARRHHEQAADLRANAQTFADDTWGLRQRYLAAALRHEVRAAERAGAVTRTVRDVALKLAATFTGDGRQLLAVAEAVAQSSDTSTTPAPAAGPVDKPDIAAGDRDASDARQTMTP